MSQIQFSYLSKIKIKLFGYGIGMKVPLTGLIIQNTIKTSIKPTFNTVTKIKIKKVNKQIIKKLFYKRNTLSRTD